MAQGHMFDVLVELGEQPPGRRGDRGSQAPSPQTSGDAEHKLLGSADVEPWNGEQGGAPAAPRDGSFVESERLGGDGGPRPWLDRRAHTFSVFGGDSRVCDKVADRGRQPGRVAWLDEDPAAAVADELRDASGPGCDDWQAEGARFEQGGGRALMLAVELNRREHERGRGGESVSQPFRVRFLDTGHARPALDLRSHAFGVATVPSRYDEPRHVFVRQEIVRLEQRLQ